MLSLIHERLKDLRRKEEEGDERSRRSQIQSKIRRCTHEKKQKPEVDDSTNLFQRISSLVVSMAGDSARGLRKIRWRSR